jgi:hypothetical protein
MKKNISFIILIFIFSCSKNNNEEFEEKGVLFCEENECIIQSSLLNEDFHIRDEYIVKDSLKPIVIRITYDSKNKDNIKVITFLKGNRLSGIAMDHLGRISVLSSRELNTGKRHSILMFFDSLGNVRNNRDSSHCIFLDCKNSF